LIFRHFSFRFSISRCYAIISLHFHAIDYAAADTPLPRARQPALPLMALRFDAAAFAAVYAAHFALPCHYATRFLPFR
jgi:hypothetical protein